MKIVLGTVQFGMAYGVNNLHGKPTMSAVSDILDHAYATGIRLLDTAEAYGDAHDRIAAFHKSRDKRFKIVTKPDFSKQDDRANLRAWVESTREKLQVDSIHGLIFHSFADMSRHCEFRDGDLDYLLRSGKVGKIGVSLYTNDQLEKALANDRISMVQMPFNLLDNFARRSTVLETARRRNVEVHTRSTFLQGLFFRKTEDLGERFRPLAGPLQKLRTLAKASGLTIGQLAMAYVMAQELIDRVVIGVENIAQLRQNLDHAGISLANDLVEEINQVIVSDPTLLDPTTWT